LVGHREPKVDSFLLSPFSAYTTFRGLFFFPRRFSFLSLSSLFSRLVPPVPIVTKTNIKMAGQNRQVFLTNLMERLHFLLGEVLGDFSRRCFLFPVRLPLSPFPCVHLPFFQESRSRLTFPHLRSCPLFFFRASGNNRRTPPTALPLRRSGSEACASRSSSFEDFHIAHFNFFTT